MRAQNEQIRFRPSWLWIRTARKTRPGSDLITLFHFLFYNLMNCWKNSKYWKHFYLFISILDLCVKRFDPSKISGIGSANHGFQQGRDPGEKNPGSGSGLEKKPDLDPTPLENNPNSHLIKFTVYIFLSKYTGWMKKISASHFSRVFFNISASSCWKKYKDKEKYLFT